MVYRIDKTLRSSKEKILKSMIEHGELGTGEIANYTGLNPETVSINCKILAKEGVIVRIGKSQKGKYRLVEPGKVPTFLSFRARNKVLSMQIMKDIFTYSSRKKQPSLDLEQFVKNIGIYILYVLIERLRPEGSWTVNRFKPKSYDPRMKNIDVLRETWLTDTIDPNLLIEQFNKYVSNNKTGYQELVSEFESKFPDIYKMIIFHKEIDEWRSKENKKNKQKSEQSQEVSKDEDYAHHEFIEDSQEWLNYLNQ